MFPIPRSKTKSWSPKIGSIPLPSHVDVECPYAGCGRSLVQAVLGWKPGEGLASAPLKCQNCRKVTTFVAIGPRKGTAQEIEAATEIYAHPAPPCDNLVGESLRIAAPRFIAVFSDTRRAELLGIGELVGVGYRKSLELLVKEWLLHTGQAAESEVKKTFLGDCIRKFIQDPRIVSCAERTAWLGNDETHFVRKWTDHDLRDLKELFRVTLHWIETDLLSREYEARLHARP